MVGKVVIPACDLAKIATVVLTAGIVTEPHDPHVHGIVVVNHPLYTPPLVKDNFIAVSSTSPSIPVTVPTVCLSGLSTPGYPGDCTGCKIMSAASSTITGAGIPSTGRSFIHD